MDVTDDDDVFGKTNWMRELEVGLDDAQAFVLVPVPGLESSGDVTGVVPGLGVVVTPTDGVTESKDELDE